MCGLLVPVQIYHLPVVFPLLGLFPGLLRSCARKNENDKTDAGVALPSLFGAPPNRRDEQRPIFFPLGSQQIVGAL